MDEEIIADEEVIVKFTAVKWPNGFEGPEAFDKKVRTVFMKDRDNIMFGHNDLKDIFMAWLQDEMGACPDSLDFCIAFEGQ